MMKMVAVDIEMVAWFDVKGIPHPNRFRYNGDEGNIVVKVDKVLHLDKSKIAGCAQYIFTCQSIINNVLKPYELCFEPDTCKWILFRI
jgi:hypothetical protein